jgi:TolB-like protein
LVWNHAWEVIRRLEEKPEKFRIPPKSYTFRRMSTRFEFGPFLFDAQRRTLLKNGAPVEVGQKCLILLETLLRAEGQVVSKSDLMNAGWQTLNIEESNLSVQIAALRKCLGKSANGGDWIRTVQRIGYQFAKPEAPSTARDNRNIVASDPRLGGKPSIAVLPFVNMSGDREQEYFADGIVEEIITALSRFGGLFVIARNSSFAYKGRTVDVKQIGRELGVRYVLEGSVRKAGSRVRITGQLIDTSSGTHLWADRFDGPLEDIFELQDQVTSNVVGAIEPKLLQAEIDRANRKPTENLDAYDFYLRGLAGVHQFTKEGNNAALSSLYRAIEVDPNFAAAFGLAARCYVQRSSSGWVTDHAQAVAETERLARRAAALGKDDHGRCRWHLPSD